ncbi:phytoene desaturase family protein [Evansella sp. AB-rgal1]|uniref:phytoene desaturase family protein n=1 Tax=Evansella sp. AB-rgal1 TaxID=3242696 RepID=UPI00359E3DC9
MKRVGILGAGIGSLVAAAYLSMHGYRVTILEKATTVGGSAGYYFKDKRTFPTGATIAFGLEQDGLLKELLDELKIAVPCSVMDHPMDVVLSDRMVSIWLEQSKWEKELARAFPEKKEQVLSFWSELATIGEDVYLFTKRKIAFPLRGYQLHSLIRFCFQHPLRTLRLGKNSLRTVYDLVKKHKLDRYPIFHEFLNAQLVDAAQTSIHKAALLPSSLALDIYRRGSFSIPGGFATIVKRLEEKIKEKGEILKKTEALHINYHKDTKWTVDTKKEMFTFDVLLNGIGKELKNGEEVSKRKETLETPTPGWGALRVDAIVSSDIKKDIENRVGKVHLPFAFQIVPSRENAKLFGDEHGPVYVTLHPSRISSGEVVQEEVLLTASVHTPVSKWIDLTKKEYILQKELLEGAMYQEIERVVPSFKKNVINTYTGTPKTYERYTGKTQVGGFPMTVLQSIVRPSGSKGTHPHYYVAGETVFPGPGTLSAALSGYFAAEAILRMEK